MKTMLRWLPALALLLFALYLRCCAPWRLAPLRRALGGDSTAVVETLASALARDEVEAFAAR